MSGRSEVSSVAAHTAETSPARGSDDQLPPLRRVLITGAAKGVGSLVVSALAGRYELVGLDHEPIHGSALADIDHHVGDLTRRPAEDLFRGGGLDAVIHLAFEDDPRAPRQQRYHRNVLGTMKLLDHVARYRVPRLVVLSTAAVYGAHPLNPSLINEDAPLRALETYWGLRDRVDADRYVQAWMWRNPQVRTTVLRPTSVLGPTVTSALKLYLQRPLVPILVGFDPLLQFLHEDDLIQALLLALRSEATGIYNCAGAGAVPLLEMIREVGRQPLPVPHVLAYGLVRRLQRLGLIRWSAPQVDFLRYNSIICDRRIREELKYSPQIGLRQTLRSIAPPRPVEYIAPDSMEETSAG